MCSARFGLSQPNLAHKLPRPAAHQPPHFDSMPTVFHVSKALYIMSVKPKLEYTKAHIKCWIHWKDSP